MPACLQLTVIGCALVYLLLEIFTNIFFLFCHSPPLETLPVDSWFLFGVPHVNVSPSCHPPAAKPAEITGPWSHATGLPNRASSQPGVFMLVVETHFGRILQTLYPKIKQLLFIIVILIA